MLHIQLRIRVGINPLKLFEVLSKTIRMYKVCTGFTNMLIFYHCFNLIFFF